MVKRYKPSRILGNTYQQLDHHLLSKALLQLSKVMAIVGTLEGRASLSAVTRFCTVDPEQQEWKPDFLPFSPSLGPFGLCIYQRLLALDSQ